MAATIPNVAKGRINEFAYRVENQDPATSGFVVCLLQDTGLDSIAVLRDYETLALILSNNTECSVASYSRLVLDHLDVGATTIDHSGDQHSFDIGDFDFGLLESGQNIAASVVAYAPDTSGATSTMIPCHISVPASAVPTNGETFFWNTPSGLWAATEPA